jgi:ribonuclease HII
MSKQTYKTTTRQLNSASEEEWRRLKELNKFEEAARKEGYQLICGIDEAGRGPLAGPVLASAVILPPDVYFLGIDDSKRLSKEKREDLFNQIVNHPDIFYSIGLIEHDEIDRINIYQATIQAMLLAVAGLDKEPDYLLVDGLKLSHPKILSEKIIRGDQLSQSIAAAAILAKVTRDRIMCEYHQKWPQYGFDTHKGYPTEKHLNALQKLGPCPIHRTTFRGVTS